MAKKSVSQTIIDMSLYMPIVNETTKLVSFKF